MTPADDSASRKRQRKPSVQSDQSIRGSIEVRDSASTSFASPEDQIVVGSYSQDGRAPNTNSVTPYQQRSASQATKATSSSKSIGDSGPAQPSAPRNNASTSFRNISACNRCRARKNKCDQDLPACKGCVQSGTPCIGIDPFLEKQIPRSYVYYLETRTVYLEKVLAAHSIDYIPPEVFAAVQGDDADHPAPVNGSIFPEELRRHRAAAETLREATACKPLSKGTRNQKQTVSTTSRAPQEHAHDDIDTGPPIAHPSNPSFSRVFSAAIKSSVPRPVNDGTGRKSSIGPQSGTAEENETSMRDSVFSIDTNPNITPANFPDKDRGQELANLYFEYSNPQIPILHREDFKRMFEDSYDRSGSQRSNRELYLLNMVFAIGAGIILDSDKDAEDVDSNQQATNKAKKARRPGRQYQPEEYHAAATIHFPGLLGAAKASSDGTGRGLEELQAILLMAAFALLRPVAPGLWYIVGHAVRLAVDLGLHFETSTDIAATKFDNGWIHQDPFAPGAHHARVSGLGRRQFMRDMRRRLWWCVYSFDRLASTVVGRPFSISDQVVTTEFPSLLDDRFITHQGLLEPDDHIRYPSYKLVAHHYFRLRLLQSEIVQVLQYQGAHRAPASDDAGFNPYMHKQLSSPFLDGYDSFQDWRSKIHERLWQWKREAPTPDQAGVKFNPQFLELNYWQAVILLYRQSVTTPAVMADDMKSVEDGMNSPHGTDLEELEEEETVYLRIAEAGRMVLRIYRSLHRQHLVNYTFLATHHLFMAGVGFLYSIWHSRTLRDLLTIEDVDATLMSASIVLEGLIPTCPPAKACKKAFDRMSNYTLDMCHKSGGFADPAAPRNPRIKRNPQPYQPRSMPGAANLKRWDTTESSPTMTSHPLGAPGRLQTGAFDLNMQGLLSGQQQSFGQAPTNSNFFDQQSSRPTLSPSLGFGTGFDYFGHTQQTMPSRSNQQAHFSPTAQSYPNYTRVPLGIQPRSSPTSHPSPPVPVSTQGRSIPNEQQPFQPTDSSFDREPSYLQKSTSNLSEDAFLAELGMSTHDHNILAPDTADNIDETTSPGQQQQYFDGQNTSAQSWDQNFAVDPFTFSVGDMDGMHDFQDGGAMDLFGNWAFGGGGGAAAGAFGDIEE